MYFMVLTPFLLLLFFIPLYYVIHFLLLLLLLFYCYTEPSFGCCDAQISFVCGTNKGMSDSNYYTNNITEERGEHKTENQSLW